MLKINHVIEKNYFLSFYMCKKYNKSISLYDYINKM
jgi:hypothetical protein